MASKEVNTSEEREEDKSECTNQHSEESDQEDMHHICQYCGDKPCFWILYESEIFEKTNMKVTRGVKKNNEFQKEAYKMYIYLKYGRLGKGTRVKIPQCAVEGIRRLWPEEDEDAYMGFKEN